VLNVAAEQIERGRFVEAEANLERGRQLACQRTGSERVNGEEIAAVNRAILYLRSGRVNEGFDLLAREVETSARARAVWGRFYYAGDRP
jgi:hypothetical protein